MRKEKLNDLKTLCSADVTNVRMRDVLVPFSLACLTTLLLTTRIKSDPSLSEITLGSKFDQWANWSLPPVSPTVPSQSLCSDFLLIFSSCLCTFSYFGIHSSGGFRFQQRKHLPIASFEKTRS
jgi:hypothetical protein